MQFQQETVSLLLTRERSIPDTAAETGLSIAIYEPKHSHGIIERGFCQTDSTRED